MTNESRELFPKGPDKTYGLMELVKGTSPMVEKGPEDTVTSWPHLLILEVLAALGTTVLLLFWSLVANAPLREFANPDVTENPAKAAWYFLNLQELLLHHLRMLADRLGLGPAVEAPGDHPGERSQDEDRGQLDVGDVWRQLHPDRLEDRLAGHHEGQAERDVRGLARVGGRDGDAEQCRGQGGDGNDASHWQLLLSLGETAGPVSLFRRQGSFATAS